MVAGEALAEVAGCVVLLDLADAGDVEVFDDEVRGDRYETGETVGVVTGVDRGDRTAIGMAEQQGAADSGCAENFGEDDLGLPMHVIHRAWQGGGIGIAVAEPGIGEDSASGGSGEFFGDIAPQGDRAEAFVEEDEGWCV